MTQEAQSSLGCSPRVQGPSVLQDKVYETLPHGPAESGPVPDTPLLNLGTTLRHRKPDYRWGGKWGSTDFLCLGSWPYPTTLWLDFKVKAASLAIPFLSFPDLLTTHNIWALPSGNEQCNQHLASEVQPLSPDLPRGRTVCLMCSIFIAWFTSECVKPEASKHCAMFLI